tara:strand:- start:1 stop:234 length:234 start_codon:yes stop_codon:yes gene_type:complete
MKKNNIATTTIAVAYFSIFLLCITLFTSCTPIKSTQIYGNQNPHCAAYAEQTNANPEVSVTSIGEDSVCVAFTFYQD